MKVLLKYLKQGTIAGAVMAMIEMVYEGLYGLGFWATPALISGVVFPDIVNMPLPLGFLLVPFVVGLLIHKITGGIFAFVLSQVYGFFGIYTVVQRMLLGGVYGLGIFVVSWYVLLPLVNPALLQLDPCVFALSHFVFGVLLGKLVR